MKRCYVSQIIPEAMIIELYRHDIEAIRLPSSHNLHSELKYHPDIVCSYFVNVLYCDASISDEIKEKAVAVVGISDEYPNDCILNNLITREYIITGKKTAAYLPYKDYDKQLITVNQGYVKCSCIMLPDESIITSDSSIYITLKLLGFDAMLVSNKSIKLNGFSNGFIGGCAGVINNSIYFTGDITKHSDFESIKSFAAKHNADIISLGNDDLYDYGGIIEIV